MRLLHLADLHLGWEPTGWPASQASGRRERRDGLLARVVDVALTERPDVVILAGDLFEHFDPPPMLVEYALRQLRRLEAAGIQLVTVPGNHDEITYASSVYRMRGREWPGLLVTRPLVGHAATIRIDQDDLHIYGLAFTGGVTPAAQPLRDFPRLAADGMHVAVFHGTLGLPASSERSLPLDAGALAAAGYDYVALGHIHRPLRRQLPRGPAVYAGCNEGKGFDDPGVPFLTFVTWAGGEAKVDEVPIAVQAIRTTEVELTLFDAAEDVEDAVAALADADAIQRVRFTGSSNLPELDLPAILARHAGSFYHLELDDASAAFAPELLRRWAAEATIRGAFVARMERRMVEAENDEQREILARALRLGVAALRGPLHPNGERA